MIMEGYSVLRDTESLTFPIDFSQRRTIWLRLATCSLDLRSLLVYARFPIPTSIPSNKRVAPEGAVHQGQHDASTVDWSRIQDARRRGSRRPGCVDDARSWQGRGLQALTATAAGSRVP